MHQEKFDEVVPDESAFALNSLLHAMDAMGWRQLGEIGMEAGRCDCEHCQIVEHHALTLLAWEFSPECLGNNFAKRPEGHSGEL